MKTILTILGLSAVAFGASAIEKAPALIEAAPKDTVSVSKQESNKSDKDDVALLNASSASEPRAVPIGLPAAYTVVRQDGLPVTYFWDPNTTNVHWRQEGSLAKTSTLPMSMTAILEGEIGVGVDSYSKFGQEKLRALAKYNANTLGKHDFDLNISGQVAPNWFFSASAYNNMDPGNVKLQFTPYADRTTFYIGALTHIYNPNGSKFSVMYKYSDVHDLTSTIQQAPYYWVGDGTVKAIDGFEIGKDNYGSDDGIVKFTDVRNGEKKEAHYYDQGHARAHEVKFMLDHYFTPLKKLEIRAKFSHMGKDIINDNTQNILTNQTREYADGSGTYTGDVQRRLVMAGKSNVNDYMFTAKLQNITAHHNWQFGVFNYHENTLLASNSVQYDHEVKANPKKLLFKGNIFFNDNASANFVDGWENKLGAFMLDTWHVNDFVRFTYGARAEWFKLKGKHSADARYAGFYIGGPTKDGNGTVGYAPARLNGINYSFSFIPTINFTKDFGFDGEINYISMYRHLQGFYGANKPLKNIRPHILGRAGLFYNHKYFSVVTSFAYSHRSGDSGRINVTSDDPNEGSVSVPYEQAITTIGWKTDLLVTPAKWFSLNVIFTLQDPKLSKYEFSAFGKDYDFSGMQMTGLSKVLLDINPRFTFKNLSIWASARYQSKQYANVGNCIFFNGRWETFAGINWKAFKNVSFNVNAVNLLDQKGPSGNVPGSALMTDGSLYYNTLIAGTYIRPFQVQFGTTVNF